MTLAPEAERTFRHHRTPILDGAPTYVPGPTTAAIAAATGIPAEEVVKLSSNEAPLGPSPAVRNALHAAADGDELHRYPSPDMADLRAAIGASIGLDADWILPADGSSETWPLVVRAYSRVGEAVLCAHPSQLPYQQLTVLHERRPQVVQLAFPFGLTAEMLLASADADTRVVLISSPNNATSRLFPLADVRALAAALPEALVVVDEHYIEATPDYAEHTAVSLLGEVENLLVTRTFSKMYGLAGMRAGYVAGAPETLAPLRALRSAWAVSLPAKHAVLAALGDRAHLERNIAVTAAGRVQLQEGLDGLEAVETVPGPAGGFLLFRVAGRSGEQIGEGLLRHGVVARADLAEGFVRVSVGNPPENERFLAALRQVIEEAGDAR